ncbi:MAG TPA: rhodanese-like domain-containing protein [Ignavibacteria bacterium]|nr:sulfurtransferase [Bacteroidota bacterium]HRI86296.1 rhodanese-like domain-containing protein [Ignavibacteria bacterium]HRJ98122.1 rhodanese-like domain-containing protein [Ignavibacteria bacterium]
MKKTFHELCYDVKKNIRECSVQDVMEMKKNSEDFILVDIREDNEFEKGRIKDAVHIGKGIIERDIHLYIDDHDKKIVLYCGGGYRSAIAAESLQKMGYTNVISMDGGWKGWNAVGGEIES